MSCTNGAGCPGRTSNGAIDRDALDAWLKAARRLCRREGPRGGRRPPDRRHLLGGAREGDGGVGRLKPIREAIEHCRSRPLERGFELGFSTVKGSPVRAPLDGGDQERGWADYFRAQARRFEISWDRTGALLDRLADMYEAYARHQDEWRPNRGKH